MIFTLPEKAPPELASISSTSDNWLGDRKIKTVAKPQAVKYKYKQRFFSPDNGRTVIELYEYPELTVDTSDFTFAVKRWGISMPCSAVSDLPRQICRKFVTLWGKATRRTLSNFEEDQWLSILDAVDYTEFSINRSEPRVYEGLLLRKEPIVYVEWSDGQRTKLPESIGAQLGIVDPGELFTAKVRIGRDEQILSIENVVIIGPQDEALKEAFTDWPKRR